jgi:hypothetical protein
MRVHIWIKKEDIINGEITEHHPQCPQPGYQNYIQVSVTSDEFVKLEDGKSEKETYPKFVEKHYKGEDEGR